MSKIIVIGTAHTDSGVCTSDALFKIIKEISPQVIFCEAAPEIFPAMLKATEDFNTPEIKTLRTIIKKNLIDIKPIDMYEDPFDGRLEAMHELFRNKIKEYFYAIEIQANETHRLGFPYLNSEESDQIHKDKYSMEMIFVEKVKNYQLTKTFQD